MICIINAYIFRLTQGSHYTRIVVLRVCVEGTTKPYAFGAGSDYGPKCYPYTLQNLQYFSDSNPIHITPLLPAPNGTECSSSLGISRAHLNPILVLVHTFRRTGQVETLWRYNGGRSGLRGIWLSATKRYCPLQPPSRRRWFPLSGWWHVVPATSSTNIGF